MNKVKVAVIGYGHLGRWHAQKAEAIANSDFIAIVEKFPEAQKKAKEAHPNIQVVSDIEEVMDQIDAAVIVTPTSFHYDLVIKLIENNKHVFCEKPMTSTFEQALKVDSLLKEKEGLVFQVGHSERCHQVWDYKKEYIDFFNSKAVVNINRYAPFKGRATDVDVVQDLMIHDIDLMLYLFEDMPVSVKSNGFKMRTDKWDHVSSDFSFENGRVVNITVGRNAAKEVRELVVTNEFGQLEFDLFQNRLLVAKSSEQSEFVKEISYERRDHLLVEQEKFYSSISTGEKVFVDIQDGLRAMEVIAKVNESLQTNKEVQF